MSIRHLMRPNSRATADRVNRYDAHVIAYRVNQRTILRDVTDQVIVSANIPAKLNSGGLLTLAGHWDGKLNPDPNMRADPEFWNAEAFNARVKKARQREELLAKRHGFKPLVGKGKPKAEPKPIPRVIDQPREIVAKLVFTGRSKLKVKGYGPWA